MKRDAIPFLSQMMQSMAEANDKLEKAYMEKDIDNFNQIKKVMFELQKKISETLEE